MMCQCRFVSCNKCTTLLGDVINRGGCAWVGADSIWEISVPSSQFCCGPKIGLKKLFKWLPSKINKATVKTNKQTKKD